MKVLLSNDDGIYSPSLRALYQALQAAGHETRVVAPAGEQSGVGCSITAYSPLFAQHLAEDDFEGYAVQGTPADCVLLGLGSLFAEDDFYPDLVVSGINRGSNASFDVLYSGTVGAAIQAALSRLPALAVSSMARHTSAQAQAAEAAKAVEIINSFNWSELPNHLVYNLNFPDCLASECKGLQVCPLNTQWQSLASYDRREAPIGRTYWWMNALYNRYGQGAENSDRDWLRRGYITLTPLNLDYTDHEAIRLLQSRDPLK